VIKTKTKNIATIDFRLSVNIKVNIKRKLKIRYTFRLEKLYLTNEMHKQKERNHENWPGCPNILCIEENPPRITASSCILPA
tara:strand:+ start:110 stop:355 length:246 start_codon:yes stop_codon:yes gene_type:complete